MPRVLVVDDEDPIRELVTMGLRYEHFQVEGAATGRTALRTVEAFRPDLIVLDVGLPDLDGFEVCRRLRADGVQVPVIFLTARKAIEDKLTGLTIGGDDYVTKPFSFAELLARIRIILHRQDGSPAGADRLILADLEVNERAHEVRRHSQLVELTPTEYNLLVFLLANAGTVLSRAQILDHVWDYDFGGDSAVVETYIYYLRKKIDAFDPPLIHTVRGVGYTIRLPPV